MAAKRPKQATAKRPATTNKKKAATRKTNGSAAAGATKARKSTKAENLVEMKPTHDQIASRAYEIWLETGCVPGNEEHNWLRAEGELVSS